LKEATSILTQGGVQARLALQERVQARQALHSKYNVKYNAGRDM